MSKHKVCVLTSAQKQSFLTLGVLPKCSDGDHKDLSVTKARELLAAGKITPLLNVSGENSVPDVFVWVRRGGAQSRNRVLPGYSVPVAAISHSEAMAAVGLSYKPNGVVGALRQRLAREKIVAYPSTY